LHDDRKDPDPGGPKTCGSSGSGSGSATLVLRIHDIMVWIRIRILGSMPLTNGSGFGSVIDLQGVKKLFFCLYFLKVHLHNFSRQKVKKKSQNNRNQGFSYYFFLLIEGSGFGSRRPKTQTDPDPQHCLLHSSRFSLPFLLSPCITFHYPPFPLLDIFVSPLIHIFFSSSFLNSSFRLMLL
jgi:hypothetical protein